MRIRSVESATHVLERRLHAICSLCFVLLLGGCVIPVVVPIPADDEPYFQEAITNVQVGITHKDDMIYLLGTPDSKYFNDSEFVYTAFAESWKVAWAVLAIVPGGGADAGLETLEKRHVLILSFDEDDILSGFEVDTAGDDFGDCTKAGICFGAGRDVMRYADTAADAKAKEFSVPEGQCAVYLYGPGNKRAYRVQPDNVYNMFSTKSFIHWKLNPGQYKIRVSPEHVSLSLNCQAGETNFVHFEYRRIKSSTIQLEDQGTGRRHIANRRLILLPSRPPESPMPPPVFAALDPLSVPPDKAHLFIIKPGIDPGTLTLDGLALGWVKQPDRFMSVPVEPGSHTLVFVAPLDETTLAIITVMAKASQSHYIVLENSSSFTDFKYSWNQKSTLIGEGALIGAGAKLRPQAIVCPGAQVGASADIGNNVTVQTGEVVPEGTRIGSVVNRVVCNES